MQEHGNGNVSDKYISPDGYKLGSWVSNQRGNKAKNILSQDCIERLETIVGWTWDVLADKWEDGFEQLQCYIKEQGDANVSKRHITTNGLRLGNWAVTQRINKANNFLSQDRIDRLEALSGWTWDVLADKWEEGFEQLQCYMEEYGDKAVPTSHISSNGFGLGTWIRTQRYSKPKNILSQDRIERLETIVGWTWDVFADRWEEGYKQLQCYVKEYGNARVSSNFVSANGFKLGNWVGSQRMNKSKNLLIQDRIDRLEALSGWVWTMKKE